MYMERDHTETIFFYKIGGGKDLFKQDINTRSHKRKRLTDITS